jgi:CubicO group peptidase (beta-lactamase class C family)
VEDLLRWDQALNQGRLISADGYEMLYRPERDDYAYGWFVRTTDGRTRLWHSGGVPGFTAYIVRYPEQALCVVVLSNVQSGVGAFARAIAERLLIDDAGDLR